MSPQGFNSRLVGEFGHHGSVAGGNYISIDKTGIGNFNSLKSIQKAIREKTFDTEEGVRGNQGDGSSDVEKRSGDCSRSDLKTNLFQKIPDLPDTSTIGPCRSTEECDLPGQNDIPPLHRPGWSDASDTGYPSFIQEFSHPKLFTHPGRESHPENNISSWSTNDGIFRKNRIRMPGKFGPVDHPASGLLQGFDQGEMLLRSQFRISWFCDVVTGQVCNIKISWSGRRDD